MVQHDSDERRIFSFIRRLMPSATEAELLEASETFDQYIRVVWDIQRRRSEDASDDR